MSSSRPSSSVRSRMNGISPSSLIIQKTSTLTDKLNPYDSKYSTASTTVVRALDSASTRFAPPIRVERLQTISSFSHVEPSAALPQPLRSSPPIPGLRVRPSSAAPTRSSTTNVDPNTFGRSDFGPATARPSVPSAVPTFPCSASTPPSSASSAPAAPAAPASAAQPSWAAPTASSASRTRAAGSAHIPPPRPTTIAWTSDAQMNYRAPAAEVYKRTGPQPPSVFFKASQPPQQTPNSGASNHFRSRYQIDFGGMPGKLSERPGPDPSISSTADLQAGTAKSHTNYVSGSSIHIPASIHNQRRNGEPLTRHFNFSKEYPLSSFQLNIFGYTGNSHRHPQANGATTHDANFQDFSKPQFASIVAPATKMRA